MAIHPAGIEMAGKVMTGPREKAELQAHSLINKWLEKAPRGSVKAPSKFKLRHCPEKQKEH